MSDQATPGVEITVIPNNGSIQKIWPFVEPMFRTATDRSSGRYETSDILGELIRGESHLWVTFTMEEAGNIKRNQCLSINQVYRNSEFS